MTQHTETALLCRCGHSYQNHYHTPGLSSAYRCHGSIDGVASCACTEYQVASDGDGDELLLRHTAQVQHVKPQSEYTEDDVRATPVPPPRRAKTTYVGAPAIFALELACQTLNAAFPEGQCYLVGSALARADFRDVDVRLMLPDAAFQAEFPGTYMTNPDLYPPSCFWEQDPKWLLLTTAISAHLSRATGLPIDFQFQPSTHANARHAGPRNAVGLRIMKPKESE